jgi:ankyrin repeat protein
MKKLSGVSISIWSIMIFLPISLFAGEIHKAIKNGQIGLVADLINKSPSLIAETDKEQGATPLHWSAVYRRPEIAKLLIDKGADVNAKTKDNMTPLHNAAQNGCDEIIELLLNSGANVNAKNIFGQTPLHIASMYKSDTVAMAVNIGSSRMTPVADPTPMDMVRKLIEKGAEVNAATSDYGLTPLSFAIGENRNDIVQFLIEKGANVNHRDMEGYTPLHLAALRGYENIVTFLLSKGANVNAKSKAGETPLKGAVKNSHERVAKLLKNKGAKE